MKEDTLAHHLSKAIEKRILAKNPKLEAGCGASCIMLIEALIAFTRSTEGMASMLLLGTSGSFITLLDVQVAATAQIGGMFQRDAMRLNVSKSGTIRCIYGWGEKGMGLFMPESPISAMLKAPIPILPPEFAHVLVYHGKGVEVIEELKAKLREEAIRIYTS